MAKKIIKKSFEQSLSRLEKIVTDLEQGEVSLEESLSLYEEGIQLSLESLETLTQAELQIKKLTKDLNGKFKLLDLEDNE